MSLDRSGQLIGATIVSFSVTTKELRLAKRNKSQNQRNTHKGPSPGSRDHIVDFLLHTPEGSHEGTDAYTAHHVNRDSGFADGFDHAEMSSSSGTSSAQDQSDRFARQQTSQSCEIRVNIRFRINLSVVVFFFQNRKHDLLQLTFNKHPNVPSLLLP